MANTTINTDNMKFDMLINPNKVSNDEQEKKVENEVRDILETTSVDTDNSSSSVSVLDEESIIIREVQIQEQPKVQPQVQPQVLSDDESISKDLLIVSKKIEYLRIFIEYKKEVLN